MTTLETLGIFFYLVDPRKALFERVEDVPDYTARVTPFFFLTILLEFVVAQFSEEHRSMRLNDGITSVAAGMVQQIAGRLYVRSITMSVYMYVWDNYRLVTTDPMSLWLWFATVLLVDMGYYWFHRASHEINLFWAAHVVHHSSEDYNLTTALRQSPLQQGVSWVFYVPLAFFIPPPMFAVHKTLVVLYQFWIHTELIGKLGPLEYILNTPSHHRVHHGCNPYCIDKNFAGTFIIWDRMFGTFAEERDDERVVFGLTHPINTFDPINVQTHHFVHIFRTAWATPGIVNKIKVVLYGPGWAPGKPRTGLIKDIPAVSYPHGYYDPQITKQLNVYIGFHFIVILVVYVMSIPLLNNFNGLITVTIAIFLLYSLTCFGALFDRQPLGVLMEATRLAAMAVIALFFMPSFVAKNTQLAKNFFLGVSVVSAVLLIWICAHGPIYGKNQSTVTRPTKGTCRSGYKAIAGEELHAVGTKIN